MAIYLYDPCNNLKTETSYQYLSELTGMKISNLASYKSRGLKIRMLNCYLMDDKTTVKTRKEWYSAEKHPDEIWKTIVGSNDRYQVSSYGRVRRLCKKHTSFILPVLSKRRGHLEVKVWFKGSYGQYKLSKIVAEHFLEQAPPGQVLRHKNGIITDNHASNLEYISSSALGKKTGHLSMSKAVVQIDIDTGEVIGEYRSAREAERMCFVSREAVLQNCKKKTKVCAGRYLFRFADEYEENIFGAQGKEDA